MSVSEKPHEQAPGIFVGRVFFNMAVHLGEPLRFYNNRAGIAHSLSPSRLFLIAPFFLFLPMDLWNSVLCRR
jgi:hypothetical protein